MPVLPILKPRPDHNGSKYETSIQHEISQSIYAALEPLATDLGLTIAQEPMEMFASQSSKWRVRDQDQYTLRTDTQLHRDHSPSTCTVRPHKVCASNPITFLIPNNLKNIADGGTGTFTLDEFPLVPNPLASFRGEGRRGINCSYLTLGDSPRITFTSYAKAKAKSTASRLTSTAEGTSKDSEIIVRPRGQSVVIKDHLTNLDARLSRAYDELFQQHENYLAQIAHFARTNQSQETVLQKDEIPAAGRRHWGGEVKSLRDDLTDMAWKYVRAEVQRDSTAPITWTIEPKYDLVQDKIVCTTTINSKNVER
ncbi:uncharacterized protein I303_103618 [Kwoniella dejecticola CBS 10117]|uniref:Uncharacterized protein n=1 Tax=Kwoniella dejecticola CBS 10117 TaxID=1296121 RepID=A0A1A6A791_9TREE|nr:uncharacterized protein I303_03640 [Kwoniella dejecticola CBS 10117]OBR85925.1 hypothetical protein I303_03640 [Kwoniella dejecticola CBS 10117]